jgi:hypothetical protein
MANANRQERAPRPLNKVSLVGVKMDQGAFVTLRMSG